MARQILKNQIKELLKTSIRLKPEDRVTLTAYSNRSNRTPTKKIKIFLKQFENRQGGKLPIKQETLKNIIKYEGTLSINDDNDIWDVFKVKNKIFNKLFIFARKKDLLKVIMKINWVKVEYLNEGNFFEEDIVIKKLRATKTFKLHEDLFKGNKTKRRDQVMHFVYGQIFIWLYDQIPTSVNKALVRKNKPKLGDLTDGLGVITDIDLDLDMSVVRRRKVKDNPNIKQLFQRGLYNCVIEAIRQQGKLKDKVFNLLNDKFKKIGVSYEDFPFISKKTSYNFRVRDIQKNIKYELIRIKGKKIIELVNIEADHLEKVEHGLFEPQSKKKFIVKTQEELRQILLNTDNEDNKKGKIIKELSQLGNISKKDREEDEIYSEVGALIFNDHIYHTEKYKEDTELLQEFYNSFSRNEYISNEGHNEDLFNFSMNSVHYPALHMNGDHIIKQEDLIGVDKNKAFASFTTNILYEKFKFPSGLEGIYKNNNQKTIDIISKNGISHIYNIDYSLCDKIIVEYLEKINFLTENLIYTHPYLYYMHENLGVRFDIKYSAISHGKKDFKYTDEQIKKGVYKKAYGICQMASDEREYTIHGSPKTLQVIAQDLNNLEDFEAYYADPSEVVNLSNNLFNPNNPIDYCVDTPEGKKNNKKEEKEEESEEIKDDTMTVKRSMDYIKNLSYMSAYFISYTLIELLEKLKNIPYKYVKKIKCDALTLDKRFENLFKIDKNDISAWKREQPNDYFKSGGYSFLSRNNFDVNYYDCYLLTEDKVKYKQFNLITGGAGCGKSTRFHKKFGEDDERLYNSLYLFPTKDLGYDFYEKFKAKYITYQKFIVKGFERNKDFKYISKHKNLIVDESTFINKDELNQIVERAKQYNFNVIFIGDLDEKRAYQLKAPRGEIVELKDFLKIGDMLIEEKYTVKEALILENIAIPFYESEKNMEKVKHFKKIVEISKKTKKDVKIKRYIFPDNKPTIYHRHLTKVHRNGGELLRRLNLIRDKDLSDKEILKLFEDREVENFEEYKKLDVSLDNIILSPTNSEVKKNNISLYKYYKKKKGNIIQKDPKTNIKISEVNNKRRIKDIKLYQYDELVKNDTNSVLGFAITAHLSQGKTYEGKVFISPKRLYTDNLLYVMLSRAKDLNNIYIEKVNKVNL